MKLLHSISSGALGNFSTYASNSDSSSTKCWLSLAPFTLHVAPLLAQTASQLSPRVSPQVQPSLRGGAGGGGNGGGEGSEIKTTVISPPPRVGGLPTTWSCRRKDMST